MIRGLKLPHDGTDEAEKYSETEYRETPEYPESKEIPDDVEKAAIEAVEDLERQEAVERMANEAAKELDELESKRKEIEDIADEAAKELDEIEREEDVDGKESFEDEMEDDLDEVRDELQDEYVNDMNRQLEGASRKDSEVEEGSEEGPSSEVTETSESYEDAGTGMVHAMETKSESESQSEGEVEDEKQEHAEHNEPIAEAEDSPDEKFRNRVTRQKSPETEQEEYTSSESVEDAEKQGLERPESSEPAGATEPEVSKGETCQEDQPELEHEESRENTPDDNLDSAEEHEESDVETEPEDAHDVEESSDASEEYDEAEVGELEHANEPIKSSDLESQHETESQVESDDVQSDVESSEREIENYEVDEISEAEDLSEELEEFVKRAQDILEKEMDFDDGYDYVQDPLTGEMQRVQKILSEYESEEQKRRRKLRNLFAKLSEEEREQFKEIVRQREESEEKSFAEHVESLWTKVVEEAEQNRNEMIENFKDYIPWVIQTWNQFLLALNHHNELRFWETFDKQCEMTQDYLDGKIQRKPKLLKKQEALELRRSYENTIGTRPKVAIESMQDVESLQAKHKPKPLSPKEQELCRKYFEVRNNWSLTGKELAILYGISPAKAGRWRNRNEPLPISRLRKIEETKILKDWGTLRRFKSESRDIDSSALPKDNKQELVEGDLNLFHLYEDAYFYFKSKNRLAQFIMNIKQEQGLNDTAGLHSTLRFLDTLLVQSFPQNHTRTYISLRYSRIKGEYLRFLLNLSNWTTRDLEKSISKITDVSGPGGISGPRFPEGIELETVLARITSVVISDSHLRSNGSITYHEPDIRRIRIVENYLQALGDIKLNPIFKKRTNHYVTELPAVIGKVLLKLGLTPGNKTLNNPGLFPSIYKFSRESLCAIFEELVPQDGTVKPNRIDWSHSHTLHSGTKNTDSSFHQLIGKEEVELVKIHGRPYSKYKRLSMGKLEKLSKDKDKRTLEIASKLMNCIYKNPNNLIQYEVEIVKKLGVDFIKEPQSVFYHKRTGAVTVSWSARTANKIEAIRLAMIAPPNDVTKRRVMLKSILDNPDTVQKILSENTEQGIDIKKWWSDEKISGGPGVIYSDSGKS